MIQEIECEFCGDIAELEECPFCNKKLCDVCMEEHSGVCVDNGIEEEE